MRKVKNKKVIQNLAKKSFGANRTRNRIAILAVALTTLLFTTIFTLGIGTMEIFQRQTMRQSGGDSHGVMKNLTREQYEKLKDHPLIKEEAACIYVADEVKNPEFLKRHVEAWYYPEYHYKHAKCFGLDHYYGADEGEVQTEKLSESFISECEAQDGFEAGGRIYSSTRFGLEASSWKAPKDILHDEKGYYWTFGSMKQYYDVDEKGAYSSDTVVYGLEDFPLEQIEVYEGEKDLKVIKEKLASGKYLLYSATTDDNGVVNEKEMAHHAGDKVTLVLPDGSKREFEILSVIKENYYALTNRYSIMFCYYTTADIFKEMESEDFLMSYLMNVEDQKEKSYGQFVENYTTTTEPLMDYESKQKYIDEFAGMKNLFILVGETLSIVIGLIGILNFINSVLTNVVTRRKEFAMMEAIGMTKKQLLRMLILEGLYYAGITILAVLVFGSLFSFTVVRVLSGGIWFMKYRFVIWPMLAACPFLILFGIVVPYLAYAPQRKNSLVEEIRKNE